MVVDDSAVVRGLLTRFLQSDPALSVVTTAADGRQAIDALKNHDVDVVVLDIEMPVMDGLTALPRLLAARRGLQVLMASTLTRANADVTLKALAAGAADYVTKPGAGGGLAGAEDFQRLLRAKVKALGEARRRPSRSPVGPPKPAAGEGARARSPADGGAARPAMAAMSSRLPGAIAFGSSTGGPQALFSVLRAISPGLPQPILITQHMPATFTSLLAEHIGRISNIPCGEARDGEVLKGGRIYVAPGDYHMLTERRGDAVRVCLSQSPPENFCRPSVDPMLCSLAAIYGQRLLAVILTGMGSDGLRGARATVEAGGSVIVQDEASSVVWGMPGAVAQAGLSAAVLPLGEIAAYVRQTAVKSVA